MKPGDNEIRDRKDQEQVEARYRVLEQDQPPAMLDQAILNKARRAVESRPVRPWNFGWMHATATAAVLVLGLTLVLQQRSEIINPVSGQNGNVPVKTESVSLPAESEEKDYLDSTSDLDSRDGEAFRAPSRQESPQAESVGAASADKKALGKVNEKLDQPAAEPAPISALKPAERTRAPVQSASEAEEDLLTAGGDVASDISGGSDDPHKWIAAILELKRAGRDDAWQAELERFRQAFPDFPLPEELGGQ